MSPHSSCLSANPAPTGLIAFGMSTILLNCHNLGFFPLNSSILGTGLIAGGSLQLLAGILDFFKGNTFGCTAFTTYGAFWISFVLTRTWPVMGLSPSPNANGAGTWLLLYGIFTGLMTVGTIRKPRALTLTFALLALLFFLLAIGDYMSNEKVIKAAGGVGLACGIVAFYTGMGEVLNETLEFSILPLGHVGKSGASSKSVEDQAGKSV